MAGLHGDQDIGYSSLEDENDAARPEQTPAMVIDAALARLRIRAGCQEDSFVQHLSTSLLSRMARNIFRRWESTRRSVDIERVPDFLELVVEELCLFAQRGEIAEEYERRNSTGSIEHDELEDQRRRERSDYRLSPRRRFSLSLSTDDPTLDLDILKPVRVRYGPDDSPMSPQRGMIDPEEMRSYQRTENVRVHRRRHSKHLAKEAEKEERRRLRRSRESSKSASSLEASMSPKKAGPDGELERSGEDMGGDLQQKLDISLLKAEPSGELHSAGEATASEDLEGKPLNTTIAKDPADAASNLQSSEEHANTEDLELKSLESSITSLISDSPSDLQGSEASITSEIGKDGTSQKSGLPSTGSGTSISSEFDNVGAAQQQELPSTEAEENITPEESSTPSDDLLTSTEGNPPIEGAQETGAKTKVSQKDKERRKKRTRQVIESMSNRQITRLTRLEITSADVLEMLFQLSVSLDRLNRLINGSRNRGSDNVDEATLAQFFEGLEYARTREIDNKVPVAEDLEASCSSSIPEITEDPLRDPKDEA